MKYKSEAFIKIESGIYKNVNLPISAKKINIGSSNISDIVIKEEAISEEHLSIEVVGDEFDVVALDDGFEILGVGAMYQGDACTLKPPFTVRIGDVIFSLSHDDGNEMQSGNLELGDEDQPVPSTLGKRDVNSWKKILGASALAAMVVGIGLVYDLRFNVKPTLTQGDTKVADLAASSFDQSPEKAISMDADEQKPDHKAVTLVESGGSIIPSQYTDEPTLPSPTLIEGALGELNTRLGESNVRNVQLEPGLGTIVASGAVLKQDYERWREVQQWFDMEHGRKVTLVAKTTLSENEIKMVPPKVEAIWTGERPHIVMNGERYLEGRALSKDWRLKRIENNKVIFMYRGEQVDVDY